MIDVDMAMALISHNFPQVEISTARPITRGWDSFVLEVNGELIFRFTMRGDVIPYLEQEFGLWPVVGPTLWRSIPSFDYSWHGDGSHPCMFVAYRKLGGTPLQA